MITFSAKVTALEKIPSLKLSTTQSTALGKLAITSVKDRVQKQHLGIYDELMPPYSDRPIYVKIGGKGNKAVIMSGNIPIKSVAAIRKAGARVVDIRGASGKLTKKLKRLKNIVYKTGDSLRFQNRTAYKRFLGKSGLRDLTDTGWMLRALIIVGISGTLTKVITIGFTDPIQEAKARGNMRWANWFGTSPSDELKIKTAVETMLSKNLGIPVSATTSTSVGAY